MSLPQVPEPSLEAVGQYLNKFRVTPTAPQDTAVKPNSEPKYKSPKEDVWRRRVVWTALPIGIFFATCAVLSLVLQRSVAPLHVGSHLLVELALQWVPDAYPLAALHNFALALVAAGLAVAASGGHMEVPGTPHRAETIVSRRTARFAAPQLLTFLVLAVVGIALHMHEWAFLAAVAEGVAFVCLLGAVAILWVPVLRMFLVVERDSEHDGLTNRLIVGHGSGWRHGTCIVLHDQILEVDSFAGVLEACFGLRSLRVVFCDADGLEKVIVLRALGSAELVNNIEHLLKGQFRSARGTAAIRSGSPLIPNQTTNNIFNR
ncbi:hypothetical protein ACG04Q_21525 [Roseateles sp. DXS20W]|uniref:PH domain-containing protein n=1 Tax=Pelomonas lactea TaxID=3299030 RepID=A0ABW7GQB0_9BURK